MATMATVYNLVLMGMKRLTVSGGILREHTRLIHGSNALMFRATSPLGAEPMKKKKKMDMGIILARESKKRRKIEKMIKRQEMKGLKLKPIEEIEGDRSVLKTLSKRTRKVEEISSEESEHRATLLKSWARYKTAQHQAEWSAVQCLMNEQSRALLELRKESEQLYQQAIQLDENLIPYEMRGPMETPPIKGYSAPDGDYVDTTRKFDK